MKSDKLMKAMNKATLPEAEHIEVQSGDGTMAITSREEALALLETTEGITTFDPMRFVRAAKLEGGIVAEKFAKLEEGQMIEGWLVDKGPTTIEDIATKLPKVVSRYSFELSSGARISLLETAQLATGLDPYPADGSVRFLIGAGGPVKTKKGLNMNVFHIVAFPGDRKPTLRLQPAAVAEIAGPIS